VPGKKGLPKDFIAGHVINDTGDQRIIDVTGDIPFVWYVTRSFHGMDEWMRSKEI
jgi:hypothetical protein